MPAKLTPSIKQLTDAPKPSQVVGAVAASSAVAARRTEQSVALVEAQRLDRDAGELGGDRDPVDTVVRGRRRCVIGSIDHESILGHMHRKSFYHTCVYLAQLLYQICVNRHRFRIEIERIGDQR